MDDIKVSVIIPIYNMEQYVGECLDSIVGQTLKEIEIICVDDGSTDNTRKILEEYAALYNNIIVLYQQHRYSGAARNLGMKKARGEFIAFIDADDMYADNKALESLYSAAKRENVNICCGGMHNFDADGKLSRFYHSDSVPKDMMVYYDDSYIAGGGNYVNAIYDRLFLKSNNIIFGNTKNSQDVIFTVKAFVCAGKYYQITNNVYFRRIVDKNYTNYQGDLKAWADVLEYLFPVRNRFPKRYAYALFYMSLFFDFIYSMPTAENIKIIDKISSLVNDDIKMTKDIERAYNFSMHIITEPEEMLHHIDLITNAHNDMMNKTSKASKVFIYGAGIIGRLLATYLLKKGYKNISGFLVTKCEDYTDKLTNLPVHAVSSKYSADNPLVLVAVWPKDYDDVIGTIKGKGFDNFEIVKYNEFIAVTKDEWK